MLAGEKVSLVIRHPNLLLISTLSMSHNQIGQKGGEVDEGVMKRKTSLICREMEQEIGVWGIICGGGGEQEEKSNHNLKGLVWRGGIYRRMRLKALSLSPHSGPSGSSVVEGERGRIEGELTMIRGCGAVNSLLTWSLAKRGFNMKSTQHQWLSHMTEVAAILFYFFQAKWHSKLLDFTNEYVSNTLQRADKFQLLTKIYLAAYERKRTSGKCFLYQQCFC